MENKDYRKTWRPARYNLPNDGDKLFVSLRNRSGVHKATYKRAKGWDVDFGIFTKNFKTCDVYQWIYEWDEE